MAIKCVKNDWSEGDCRRDFIVDSNEDFANLPECCTGSTALSPSGDIMVVNASGEWVKFGG